MRLKFCLALILSLNVIVKVSGQSLPRQICFQNHRLSFDLFSNVSIDSSWVGDVVLGGCVSDNTTGKLLFYSRFGGIVDSTHTIIPNGTPYPAACADGTQSILFNKPKSDSLYYCFYALACSDSISTALYYSIVNRNLNNGKGAVIPAYMNVRVDSISNSNTKVAATLHANGCDVWVVSHQCNGDTYFFYLVNDTGVTGPVSNQIGNMDQCNLAIGCFKFSPDGKKFIGYGSQPFIELFDFDKATGVLSNPQLIQLPAMRDGVSFSPDNSKIYVSTHNGELLQFNLALPTLSDIINSKTVINPYSVFSQNSAKLQLGPDGKIYVSPRWKKTIAVINYPDSIGLKCDFHDSLFLLNITPGASFSQFIENPFNEVKLHVIADSIVCAGDTVYLHIDSVDMATGFAWTITDVFNTTTLFGADTFYVFNYPGDYLIKIEALYDCLDSRSKTFGVHVNPLPTVSIIGDTSFCSGQSTVLYANGIAGNFLWSNGSSSDSVFVTQAGIYSVIATNSCGSAQATVNVQVNLLPSVSIIGDTVLCNGDSVLLFANGANVSSYLWSTGSTVNSIQILQPGLYSVTAFNDCGLDSATFYVGSNNLPTVTILGDTIICEGETVLLYVTGIADYFLWSTGSTNDSIKINQQGIYSVTGFNECGDASSSANINYDSQSFNYHVINVFTPNDDNENDYYVPVDNLSALKFFQIFDRWGKEIFHSESSNEKWDGKINSKNADEGVYFFNAQTIDCNGNAKNISGFLHLIR